MRVGGIDVGGTMIKAGVLEGDSLTHVRSLPTPAGPEALVDQIAELLGDLGPLDAVGMVVPGIVDADAGVAVWAANLGWRDVAFRALLEKRTGLPVAFGHDVRAGALAEASLGAGAGHRDVAFLPLGTGVAAGIVLDGHVLERAHAVGEVGHVDVGHGETCACGLTGCLEAIASAAAVSARFTARTGRPATAEQVAALVEAGDADAAAVWAEAVAGLGEAITWLAAVLAPDVVVLGGGLAQSGDTLLRPLAADLDGRLTFHHRPLLVRSAFGDRAGCVGAALLGRRLVA